MKQKHYGWVAAAALVIVAAWFGRSAWRAHRGLVTLQVRNAPLAEVVRELERQTKQRIRFDHRLDTAVTLTVKDKPLAMVLDRLSQQCGARWTTVYAVYESAPALRGLEAALRGEKKLAEAGWKTLAPAGLVAALADPRHSDAMPGFARTVVSNRPAGVGPAQVTIRGGGPASDDAGTVIEREIQPKIIEGLPRGAIVATTEDQEVSDAGASGANDKPALKAPGRQRSPVVRIMRRSLGGGDSSVEEEVWSPTELVIETRLSRQLKGDFSAAATPEAAMEAARQLNGQWKTYYALRKSSLAMGFSGMPGMSPEPSHGYLRLGGATGAANDHPVEGDLAESLGRQRLEELGKLTPEQRVLRARERQGLNAK